VHLVSEENAGKTPEEAEETATAPHEVAAAETASPETGTGEVMTDAAVPVDAGTRDVTTRRRRYGLIGLAVLAAVAGVVGSWVYNSGYKSREANNSAVIRSAADPSTYVAPGDFTELTVPIRNDSPDAITVVGLTVPNAPRILWDGKSTVIQPGSTAYLQVKAPSACAATPHPLPPRSSAVSVTLRVVTANGKPHGGLRTSVYGVIQYAADYCAPKPTASATAG
jgi:hypothetical protein